MAFAGAEVLHAHPPTAFSWANARNAFVTAEARYEVGRFAQRELGINGWTFDAILEGVSFAGRTLFGDAYHQTEKVNGPDDVENVSYIGGYGDRDPSTGWLFSSAGDPDAGTGVKIAHYAGEFVFDTNDQILQWQGLPDAGGLVAMAKQTLGYTSVGHSLGASRYSTLRALGAVGPGQVAALPIGMVSPDGVTAYISGGDIVTGFRLGEIFNPSAIVVHVPFIVGHAFDSYTPSMHW